MEIKLSGRGKWLSFPTARLRVKVIKIPTGRIIKYELLRIAQRMETVSLERSTVFTI